MALQQTDDCFRYNGGIRRRSNDRSIRPFELDPASVESLGTDAKVIGIAGFENMNRPGSGASAARALRAASCEAEIVALGRDPFMTGAWSENPTDQVYSFPELDSNESQILEIFTRLSSHAPIDSLLVCDTSWAELVAPISGKLQQGGIRNLVPSPDRLCQITGPRLFDFLFLNQIPTPPSIQVENLRDVRRYAEQLEFPIQVLGPSGVSRRVYDSSQATVAARDLRSQAIAPVTLQRVLSGDVIDVAMVMDSKHNCEGLVATRCLAMNDAGEIICRAVIDDPRVSQLALKLAGILDWSGPLEIRFVRPAGTRSLQVCEMHCRLPSWSMLTHWAGCNLAAIYLRLICGQKAAGCPRARTSMLHLIGVNESVVEVERLSQINRVSRTHKFHPTNKPCGSSATFAGGRNLNVAVTGIGTFDVINPGLGVARALRHTDNIGCIYGLAYGTLDSGIYDGDLFDAALRLPATSSESDLLSSITAFHRTHPIDVLIPCLDGELLKFIRIKETLSKMGIETLLPTPDAFHQRSKINLTCGPIERNWGKFQIPAGIRASNESGTLEAVEAVGYPAVVKGPVSECIRVNSREDVKRAWAHLNFRGAEEVIVQALISGPSYATAVVCRRDHSLHSSLTIKKTAICSRGSTWSAIYSPQTELEMDLSRFFNAIDWVGPAEAEFIYDELCDRFFLIELNPRFTGWIYYSAALGSNHPAAVVGLAAGREPPRTETTSGLAFMRSYAEIPLRAADLASVSSRGYLSHV